MPQSPAKDAGYGRLTGNSAGLPAPVSWDRCRFGARFLAFDRKNIGPLMEVARVREPFSFGTPERRRFAMQFGYDMRPSFWQGVRSNSHLVIAAIGTAALLGVAAVALWLALPASDRQAAASPEQTIPTIPVKTTKIAPVGAAVAAAAVPQAARKSDAVSPTVAAAKPIYPHSRPMIRAGPVRSRRLHPLPPRLLRARWRRTRHRISKRRHSRSRQPIPMLPLSLPRWPRPPRPRAATPMAHKPPPSLKRSRRCRHNSPRPRKATAARPRRSHGRLLPLEQGVS